MKQVQGALIALGARAESVLITLIHGQHLLHLRGLWDQETNVVLVTSGKANPGVRSVMGSRIVVHRVSPDHFFGFDQLRYGAYSVPVSDLEKTLIDLVYFREPPGPDVVRALAERADPRVLRRHLSRYHDGFVSKFERELAAAGAKVAPRKDHGPR